MEINKCNAGYIDEFKTANYTFGFAFGTAIYTVYSL